MRDTPAQQCAFHADSGFALLIVLWILVLIAFITMHVTVAGRTEVRIATNLAANAVAQAAADGAIFEAIFNLSDPRPDHRWMLDGRLHELQIGNSRITLRVEDETGRINPNLASTALLEGLLRAVGSEPETAAALAAAIKEWVGSTPVRRTAGELLEEYRAAGLKYGPPASPLESIDELARVREMSTQLLEELRPHLSLFSPATPNPASLDPLVVAAIALSGDGAVTAVPSAPVGNQLVTARILATALGPGNAETARAAIVRIGQVSGMGYSLLTWENEVK